MKRLACGLLLFAALLSAGTPVVSQKKLDAWVRQWQRVLLLDDWQIEARCVRLSELPKGASGLSEVDKNLQVERILVLDPRDYPELAKRDGIRLKQGKAIVRDIEDTILHEILHLRLRSFSLSPADKLEDAEEMVVNRLTTALLNLK